MCDIHVHVHVHVHSMYRVHVLETAKKLVEDTKKLVSSAAGSQEMLAEAARQAVKTIQSEVLCTCTLCVLLLLFFMGWGFLGFLSPFFLFASVLYTCMYMYSSMYMYVPLSWQNTHLEDGVSWVRIPPEAAHFSLEKRVVSGVVVLCCIVLLCLLSPVFIMCVPLCAMCVCVCPGGPCEARSSCPAG